MAKAGATRPAELAREVWLLSEGAISLMLVHGDRRYAATAAEAARKLVLGGRHKPTQIGGKRGSV